MDTTKAPIGTTRERVIRLASLGTTAEEIAIFLKITIRSLNALYEDVIKAAVARAKVKAMALIHHLAHSGKVTATSLVWAKTFLTKAHTKKEKQPIDPASIPELRVMNHLGEILGSGKFIK